LIGFFLGLFVFLVLEFKSKYLLCDLLIYCVLAYCYFHFVNLAETARRIRILTELINFPSRLTEKDILSLYNADQVIENRLLRLLSGKQIIKVNDRYFICRPIALWIAQLLFGIRTRILMIR